MGLTHNANGYLRRLPLTLAWSWLDGLPLREFRETLPLGPGILGRRLAEDVLAPWDMPAAAIAISDGIAVRADDTIGANGYNPITLTLRSNDGLGAGMAVLATSGSSIPASFDAVLSADRTESNGMTVDIIDGVPRGEGIAAQGQTVRAGQSLLASGRRIGTGEWLLLAEAAVQDLRVVGRARVAVIAAGAKHGPDTVSPILSWLIEQDGGEAIPAGDPEDQIERRLAKAAGVDLIVLIGRSGLGTDDVACATIETAGGQLDHHGVAVRPGGSCGLGRLGGVPVILIPGDPLAAHVIYHLLVSRLLRRWAGLAPSSAALVEGRSLTRKISSPIGLADWVPVAFDADGRVTPVPIPPAASVAVLGRADGFVLVPAPSEGFAPGEPVTVTLFKSHKETPS